MTRAATAPSPPAGGRRPASEPRRTRRRDWVPQQHGAWAMLVVPLVVGVAHAGARPWHALLAAAWLVGYLAFASVAVLLKSRWRARYRLPAAVYGGAAVLLGLALLAARPTLAWWAVGYLPLVAISLAASWRRAERSWLNDGATVLAACLLAAVAHTPAEVTAPPTATGLAGGSVAAWQLVAVLAWYFLGTVVYVKSMIRERGNRAVLVASVIWHVLAAASMPVLLAGAGASDGRVADWAAPVLAAFFLALAVRASLVPWRWPRARPMTVGLGEVAASAVLTVLLLAA